MAQDIFPPFAGLKAFYEVALTGSAVGAAARLGVSASAISHQIRTLEAELGVRLIENRRGKLCLTPDGIRYYDRVKGAMSEILRATEAVRSGPGRKRVSLTLTPSFAAGWLMPRLADLERAHPDLEVNLVATTRVVDLARDNVDLAIRRGSGDWAGCVSAPLLREILAPVAAPGFVVDLGAPIAEVLARARILVNTTVEGEWDDWCAGHGLAPPDPAQRYDLETYELTIQAARDGLGIALGRRPLIDPVLAEGGLVQVFDGPSSGNISYFIVRRDEPMRSDAKRLYDWLQQQES